MTSLVLLKLLPKKTFSDSFHNKVLEPRFIIAEGYHRSQFLSEKTVGLNLLG